MDAGVCCASISPIMHSQSQSPTLLQSMLFHARPVEYRDIGLSSQVSTASSWVRLRSSRLDHVIYIHFKISGDTSRPLKRKSPPGTDHPQESRAPPAKNCRCRSSVGSGSHRRSRRAPSVVCSHRPKSTSSRSVKSVTGSHLSGQPPSPVVLHSVKEESVDSGSQLGEELPPSPSISSSALFGEPSSVVDGNPNSTPVPEPQPPDLATPIREAHPFCRYPSPPHHVRPSRLLLPYPSAYPSSPSPLANVGLPLSPESSPAPTVH